MPGRSWLPGLELEVTAPDSGASDEWLSPPWLIRGLPHPLALDPCADAGRRIPAARHLVGAEGADGLAEAWAGRCYVNPPYSKGHLPRWIAKCHGEYLRGAEVIALVPVRTDSAYWWQHIWGHARIGFLEGRIAFGGSDQAGTFGSALVVWARPGSELAAWAPGRIGPRRVVWVGL